MVSRERSRRVETLAISSMAARKEASLAFDGLVKPVIFLTNCNEAERPFCGNLLSDDGCRSRGQWANDV